MADVEEIGNGDYKLNVGDLSEDDSLEIAFSNMQNDDAVNIIFSSIEGVSRGAVRVIKNNSYSNVVGDTAAIVGSGMSWKVPSSKKGCVAIVVNGVFFARCALYDNLTTVDDCCDLPLPITAVGDSGVIRITIGNHMGSLWAGWQSNIPAGSVAKIIGFNLPRAITSSDGDDSTMISADGGNYGIEFAIPNDSVEVAIFDEIFWLYLRQ